MNKLLLNHRKQDNHNIKKEKKIAKLTILFIRKVSKNHRQLKQLSKIYNEIK